MSEFENKLNSLLEERKKKYEEDLNTIQSDYNQKLEKIRQELYQSISEKQENSAETKTKKRKAFRKWFYYAKKFAKTIKKNFKRIIKSRKNA